MFAVRSGGMVGGLAVLVIWGASLAAGEKPWTLEDLMDLKTVSDPQITADGSRVAFVVTAQDAHRNAYSSEIRVVAVTGGRSERLAETHFSDHHPQWSPDGRTLAFLSRRDGSTQIYAATLPNGAPHKLTHATAGVMDFKWSPDGRHIGYIAADPNPELEARRRAGDDAIVGGEGYTPAKLHIVGMDAGDVRT